MKQKHNHSILNRYTTGILVLLVLAAASLVVITKHNRTDAAPKPKVTPPTSIPSQFSFSSAPNWYQGATSKSDIALFHHIDGCFVSLQHKTGTIDPATEIQKSIALEVSDGHTVTPISIQTLTLQTNTRPQQYQLHQYSASGSDAGGMIEGGQELGYLQLSGSYVFVQANCSTADELPSTLQALQAVKFDPVHLTAK